MALRRTTRVTALASKYQTRQSRDSTELPSGSSLNSCSSDEAKSSTRKRPAVQIKIEEGHEADGYLSMKMMKPSSPNVADFQGKSVEVERKPDNDVSDVWTPPNWMQVLDNIRLMRKGVPAPVDVMGCDMCHDQTESPKIQRYQILVSLMLSSQTKDQVTFAAMGRLRTHGLTPENIVITSNKVLEDLIKPVGFYKRKSEYIKKASQILLDSYGGDIPKSVEELCKLPGVGPKMAHICMNCAWNIVSGIGVDTHVHRISQRLGWLPTDILKKRKTVKNVTPEDTRVALENWLPPELWSEVNHLLVGFGQTICKPIGPMCSDCLNKSICPSAKLKR